MADPAEKRLPNDRLGTALAAIQAWRQTPARPQPCPVCGISGLAITDRSARPRAEWYVLACAACGLDHTLHLPMAPPQNPFD